MGTIIFCLIVVSAISIISGIVQKVKFDELKESAENGVVSAQYELGYHYFVKVQDIDKAIYWLVLSGEYNGYGKSLELLNRMESSGVPRFRERINNARQRIERIR